MGLASPIWIKAIDTYGVQTANPSTVSAAVALKHNETNNNLQNRSFVDPALAAAALNKPAPQVNKGAQY